MRKIDETKYQSFCISFNGCNVTLFSLKRAINQYKDIEHATLYGNKPDGTRAILDQK